MEQKEKRQRAGHKEIDEEYLIAMMAKEEPPTPSIKHLPVETNENPQIATEPKREENDPRKESESRKRKPRQTDYESLFLKNSEETARYGKTIYIRREFHERTQRIVQTLGDNQVSLYSYIDNVLVHHFEMYQDEIREGYEKKQKPIF